MICVNVVSGSYIRKVYIVDATTCEDAMTTVMMASRQAKENGNDALVGQDEKLMAQPIEFPSFTASGRIYRAY